MKTIKGKCPKCGHGEVVATEIKGNEYSGHCPQCGNVVFGFLIPAEDTDAPTRK